MRGWRASVLLYNRSFSFVSNAVIRKHFRQEPIYINTLLKYMEKLAVLVEWKSARRLTGPCALVLDRWFFVYSHDVGIFAIPSPVPEGYEKALLSILLRLRTKKTLVPWNTSASLNMIYRYS